MVQRYPKAWDNDGYKTDLVREDASGIPNIHYGELKEACRFKPSQFVSKFGFQKCMTKNGKVFYFKDNGAKVLFVAHLDSVKQGDGHIFDTAKLKPDTLIYSPVLDDRLGVYVGLYYLQKAGVKVDWLLTTDEEKGRSTGLYFKPPKDYNWMFMFDRMGEGAVLYDYYNDEQLKYKLGKHNFSVGRGTYSCIKDMKHVGCVGINFGVGYYDNHTDYAFASKNALVRQLRKFLEFYAEYQNVRMPYVNGYERFAQSVVNHSSAYKESLSDKYQVSPSEDSEELTYFPDYWKEYGTKKKIDAEEASFVELDGVHIEKPDSILEREKKIKETTTLEVTIHKSGSAVSDEGKLVNFTFSRVHKKLYWDINVLPIDPVVRNILRNTFKMHTLYDVAKDSPYRLVTSGYLTAQDADQLVNAMDMAGFGMRMNMQGLMTPNQYEKHVAVGYKSRSRAVRNLPKYSNPTAKGSKVKGQEKPSSMKINDAKTIDIYPLPHADHAHMINQCRDLVKAGYNVVFSPVCLDCKKEFKFDFINQDKIPDLCPSCQAVAEKQLSLFKEMDASPLDDSKAGILTKIILEKDPNDDTEFRYIGKASGTDFNDKFAFVKPAKESKFQIGFVVADAAQSA